MNKMQRILIRLWRRMKQWPLLSFILMMVPVCMVAVYIWDDHVVYLWYDWNSLPMSQYQWPLEVDTEKVIREYKQGKPSIQQITPDTSSIVLFPNQKQCLEHTLLTVLIKTRVHDRTNRDLLRRTWVNDLHKNRLRHAFLLGQCTSMQCKVNLAEELADHADIVQGDFVDTYYNNTLKFKVGLKYVAYHCNNTQYTLIIDGDYSLNVNRLIQYLGELNYPKNLYAGQLWPSSRPFRNPKVKQHMTYEFYPFRRLPPFIAAGASLLSTELIEPMSIIARYTKHVDFDDVFYGMVAKKLSIPLVDASDILPSWVVPSITDVEAHRRMIGSHRFGKLEEVETIHRIIHGIGLTVS